MTNVTETTRAAASGKSGEQAILSVLVEILEDMIADWDMDLDEPLGTGTRLIIDLGFESIDVVQFIAAIEEHYRNRSIPFEELVMKDGRYVDEIVVGNVVTFLKPHLAH
ncbi:MAG: acyl carrier protein [Halioglobus sp.]|nr:acyl carrier protein [Halioglobus sp.]